MITLSSVLQLPDTPSEELRAKLEYVRRVRNYEGLLLARLLRDGVVTPLEALDELIATEPTESYDAVHEATVNVWSTLEKAQHYLPPVQQSQIRHRIEA